MIKDAGFDPPPPPKGAAGQMGSAEEEGDVDEAECGAHTAEPGGQDQAEAHLL